MKVKSLSRVLVFVTPQTAAYQASPPMGFSRQEYLSGLPFPSPGDLPHPGIEPGSPTLRAAALLSEPPGKTKYFFEPLFFFFGGGWRQEYWSGLPFPSPGDLPHPGIEPGSLALQADSLLSKPS